MSEELRLCVLVYPCGVGEALPRLDNFPMKISEIFYSIQGEGMLAGVPSVFIRTSGCNLRCTWCDTPYTSWKPEGYQMMYGPMLNEIRRHWCGHVVITGGEPMILPDIVELTQKIKEIDQHITIETAGTMYQKVDLRPDEHQPEAVELYPI